MKSKCSGIRPALWLQDCKRSENQTRTFEGETGTLCMSAKRMKAVDQPGEPDSELDYTTLWTIIIDRCGL